MCINVINLKYIYLEGYRRRDYYYKINNAINLHNTKRKPPTVSSRIQQLGLRLLTTSRVDHTFHTLIKTPAACVPTRVFARESQIKRRLCRSRCRTRRFKLSANSVECGEIDFRIRVDAAHTFT